MIVALAKKVTVIVLLTGPTSLLQGGSSMLHVLYKQMEISKLSLGRF